jgi:hypothetical protein
MTIKEDVDLDFQRYIEAHMPSALSGDTSAHGQAARDSWIGDARRDWLSRLSLGWRPGEILGDLPAPTVNAGGRVMRLPRSEVSAELEYQAAEVSRAMGERGLRLDGLAQHALNMAIDSTEAKVRGAIQDGLDLIRKYDAREASARADRAAMPVIRVTTAFTGPGSKPYPAGDHRVDQAELDVLVLWAKRLEEEAALRRWSTPHGIPEGSWPVYYVVGSW